MLELNQPPGGAGATGPAVTMSRRAATRRSWLRAQTRAEHTKF